MELRYFFTGWTKEKAFWFFGLVLLVTLSIFISLNVGVGQSVHVNSTVTSIGISSSAPYDLPRRLITFQLNNGKLITIEMQNDTLINKGDKVILNQKQRLLTSTYEYTFYRVLP